MISAVSRASVTNTVTEERVTCAAVTRKASAACMSLELSKAYLSHPLRCSVCFLKACQFASRFKIELPYRLRCLDVGQRVIFGVSFSQASGGIYTEGRESGGCGIRGCDYCSLCGWGQRELCHGGVGVWGFVEHRLGHAISTGAGVIRGRGHVARRRQALAMELLRVVVALREGDPQWGRGRLWAADGQPW